jgi:hypothetical protein
MPNPSRKGGGKLRGFNKKMAELPTDAIFRQLGFFEIQGGVMQRVPSLGTAGGQRFLKYCLHT